MHEPYYHGMILLKFRSSIFGGFFLHEVPPLWLAAPKVAISIDPFQVVYVSNFPSSSEINTKHHCQ